MRRRLLDKRLVIVTGKGGVGKSTVALALALAAARQGKRTILCEVSAQEHLSHVFHRAEVGFHEVEMAENLWAISIDPDESMREYVLLQLKVRAMRDLLFRSRIFGYLAAATPGLKELVTIGKIWELALEDRMVKSGRSYDQVIVDAPATGHGVGFLQTPRTFANVAR
ncbi:MAG: ArsA family ATPase, partial [Solirubrobacterales bacterium]